MSYSRCKVAFAVCSGYALRGEMGVSAPDADGFRESLPAGWRHLFIGPVPAPLNGYVMFALLWDGSGEGWDDAGQGDEIRRRFLDLFSFAYEDHSSPFSVLQAEFRWGGDEPGARYEPELIVTSNAHRQELHPFRGVTDDSLARKLDRMAESPQQDGSEQQAGFRAAVAQIREHFGLAGPAT